MKIDTYLPSYLPEQVVATIFNDKVVIAQIEYIVYDEKIQQWKCFLRGFMGEFNFGDLVDISDKKWGDYFTVEG